MNTSTRAPGTGPAIGQSVLLNVSIPFIEIERQIMSWTASEDFARSLIYP